MLSILSPLARHGDGEPLCPLTVMSCSSRSPTSLSKHRPRLTLSALVSPPNRLPPLPSDWLLKFKAPTIEKRGPEGKSPQNYFRNCSNSNLTLGPGSTAHSPSSFSSLSGSSLSFLSLSSVFFHADQHYLSFVPLFQPLHPPCLPPLSSPSIVSSQ